MCRWFSWVTAAQSLLKYWHSLLLVLVHHGLQEGHFTSQSALWDSRLKVKRSSQNIEKQALAKARASSKNALHLCAKILSNTSLHLLTKLIVAIIEPISMQHSQDVIALKTLRGSIRWWQWMGSGGFSTVLASVLGSLHALPALQTIVFDIFNYSTQAGANVGAEDDALAKVMLQLCMNLVGECAIPSLYYSHGVPGIFASLATTTSAEALCSLQKMWQTLEELEASMATGNDVDLRDFHDALLWPKMMWPREVFLALLEAKFKSVPEWVRSSSLAMISRFCQTKINEDGFGMLRAQEGRTRRDR